MANHKSSKKRIRQDLVIRLRNRYYKKSARTAIAKLRALEDKTEAVKYLPKEVAMIDKLAKKNTWHKNKASNLKSKLQSWRFHPQFDMRSMAKQTLLPSIIYGAAACGVYWAADFIYTKVAGGGHGHAGSLARFIGWGADCKTSQRKTVGSGKSTVGGNEFCSAAAVG